MHLYNITSYNPNLPVGTTYAHNTLLGGSLTFTRIDSLFRRPVIYAATGNAITDPVTGQHRFVFSALASITLRKTPNTTLSVGVLLLPDPTAPAPIIPFISYYHKFTHGYSFSLDPSAIALRKELNNRNSLLLSNNISGNLSLFRRDIVSMPFNQVYSTFEMKSGLLFEHKMTGKAIFSISGGVNSTFTSKVLGDNNSKDAFIKNTQSMVPYIKVGISILPFWKGLAH